jgi:hypothetical protein
MQSLLRSDQMPQQGGALAVETNAFHDHAGQKSENHEIETPADDEQSAIMTGHHRTTLAGGVDRRRFT